MGKQYEATGTGDARSFCGPNLGCHTVCNLTHYLKGPGLVTGTRYKQGKQTGQVTATRAWGEVPRRSARWPHVWGPLVGHATPRSPRQPSKKFAAAVAMWRSKGGVGRGGRGERGAGCLRGTRRKSASVGLTYGGLCFNPLGSHAHLPRDSWSLAVPYCGAIRC